ncbi:MAG TPA: hypothetical protein VGT03_14535 [Candidatus Acidoferrales bacterium]|nr:hypothetical protein [Candidatus Acidoferrales bacterium]
MRKGSQLVRILDQLEKFYGPQKPSVPTTPYEMVLHRNCGYPQSDARCDKGFANLKKEIGLRLTVLARISLSVWFLTLDDFSLHPKALAPFSALRYNYFQYPRSVYFS